MVESIVTSTQKISKVRKAVRTVNYLYHVELSFFTP